MSFRRKPAGRAGGQLQRAFFRQRLQMVFRRARRREAQTRGDLGARGRHAGGLDVAADPVEDLLLPGGEARRRFGKVGRDPLQMGEGAAGAG